MLSFHLASGNKSVCAAGGRASKLIYCAVVSEGRRRFVAEDIRWEPQAGPSKNINPHMANVGVVLFLFFQFALPVAEHAN